MQNVALHLETTSAVVWYAENNFSVLISETNNTLATKTWEFVLNELKMVKHFSRAFTIRHLQHF